MINQKSYEDFWEYFRFTTNQQTNRSFIRSHLVHILFSALIFHFLEEKNDPSTLLTFVSKWNTTLLNKFKA